MIKLNKARYSESAPRRSRSTSVFDFFLTAFVVGPICIFNWNVTYELFDLLLKFLFGGNSYFHSYFGGFAVSQLILLVLYFLQHFLQDLHRRYLHDKRLSFCFPGILRLIYIYALLIAYTGQWKSIWHFYGLLFEANGSSYQFYVSFGALLAWVFMLNNSLKPIIQVIPFDLQPDHDFDNYFSQSAKIKYKRVIMELEFSVWLFECINPVFQVEKYGDFVQLCPFGICRICNTISDFKRHLRFL
jgi:hypothetical protein